MTTKNLFAGRRVAVLVIAAIFGILNVIAITQWVILGLGFGADILSDVNNAIWLLSPFMYALIVVFAARGIGRLTALFLIPVAITDLLLIVWYLSVQAPLEMALPIISFVSITPEYFANGILVALELPAVMILAVLLLLPTRTNPSRADNVFSQASQNLQASTMPNSFCTRCGQQAGSGKFCSHCGHPIGSSSRV